MKKQTYLIMIALVTCCAAFALSSCTPNPAEEPGSNGQDNTVVQNPDKGSDSKEENILPVGALSGLFSVNADGKQVRFSQGNLQYTQSTNTWSFAEQQYDYIGEANVSGNALADKIDLFGWSGSTGAKWGISTSISDSYYTGDFVEWGMNPIRNGGNKANLWRTLTYDEWYYLLWKRIDCDELIGIAQVAGVNGLILLPDNFTLPAGLSFKSGFAKIYGNSAPAYGEYQSYTQQEWTKLESAGAVFLLVSGIRGGAILNALDYIGCYWVATSHDDVNAYYLSFGCDGMTMSWHYRYFGHSVRLVQDVH